MCYVPCASVCLFVQCVYVLVSVHLVFNMNVFLLYEFIIIEVCCLDFCICFVVVRHEIWEYVTTTLKP